MKNYLMILASLFLATSAMAGKKPQSKRSSFSELKCTETTTLNGLVVEWYSLTIKDSSTIKKGGPRNHSLLAFLYFNKMNSSGKTDYKPIKQEQIMLTEWNFKEYEYRGQTFKLFLQPMDAHQYRARYVPYSATDKALDFYCSDIVDQPAF